MLTCLVAGLLIVAALATVPLVASGYQLALGITLLSYIVLATAWALFSGPTRYISLATVAFFGIGAYTVGVLGEVLAWPLVVAIAALIGVAVALVVGLSTLRLSGMYFVIFTFGLAELIRQLATWYEVNVHRSVGRYVFIDVTQAAIYWQLLALVVLVLVAGWAIGRSRLGLALRVIGDDETVARHCGIDTTRAKLTLFALSAVFTTVTGAVMAPRWTYIDPAIAFNPMLSFQVVIMALLGGAGTLLGPLLGVIPLVLLFEVISANFPNHFRILLGIVFIVIVYLVPDGVAGLLRPLSLAYSPPSRGGTPVTRAAILTIDRARKAFGGLVAVDDIAFSVGRGEIVGLIGPNGSGKTTMLNLISGAFRPTTATSVSRARRSRHCPSITSPPRHRPYLPAGARAALDDRPRERDRRARVPSGRPVGRCRRAARRRAARARRARPRAATRGQQLTYIDQKRLELARALALSPDLLLLDEWLAGLNPSELIAGIALVRSLRQEGLSIILVEHVMDAIRSLCDRCIVMNAGRKIAEGSPASVLADPHVVSAYLGEADA